MMHHTQYGSMAGALDEKAANMLSDTLSKAVGASLTGGPKGSAASKDRADFYALTLALTGEKFLAMPQGKKLVNKVSWMVALPAFLAGVGLGWVIFKKRGV